MADGEHPSAWTRLFRRLFHGFLSRDEKKRIAALIDQIEQRTSGEIHVHIVGTAPGDILEAAKKTFLKLKLDKTDQRNCVLLLISHLDHRFAIWADEGINAKAGQALWDDEAAKLKENFSQHRYAQGIEQCVREIGEELVKLFPGKSKNQLPGIEL